MKSIISLAGDIGSGKGTVGKILTTLTGYAFISTGDILRNIATNLNMSIVELNKYAETHPEIDSEADNRLMEIERHKDNVIVDSRLAWHFIPSSFKVYLSATYETAGKRIYLDRERKAENAQNIEILIWQIKERRELELNRFSLLYSVRCDDYRNYDLIIQSDHAKPENIVNIILQEYNTWKACSYIKKVYLSPKSIFPMENIRNIASVAARQVYESVKDHGFDFSEYLEIVKKDDFFYLWDGHKRCSAALLNNISLVPAVIKAFDENELIMGGLSLKEYIDTTYDKSLVYDWEECHKFRFENYPQAL